MWLSRGVSPGNLQITDATVADLCHTLKTPWGALGDVADIHKVFVWMRGILNMTLNNNDDDNDDNDNNDKNETIENNDNNENIDNNDYNDNDDNNDNNDKNETKEYNDNNENIDNNDNNDNDDNNDDNDRNDDNDNKDSSNNHEYDYMEVFWNGGTPKASIFMVCSIINDPFGGTPH